MCDDISPTQQPMAKSVAVLGAGATGLVSLRHLLSKPNLFNKVVAYDQLGQVGGMWVYTDKVGKDEHGQPIVCSIYKSLRALVPKEVMAFPDFPFPPGRTSFITHQQVLQYLEDYADHFELKKHIKFNTLVEKVHPIERDGQTKWQVDVRNVLDDEDQIKRDEFDIVFVCNGHTSVPNVPEIPEQEIFEGEISHSRDYRCPDPFKGKTLLILGAGFSGQEIALDIAPFAKKIILSHNKNAQHVASPLPENVVQKSGIESFTHRGVKLLDGEEVDVDAVMFCTGYQYSFPFLSKECNVEVNDGRVTPLYKHVIHTIHPSLIFIGICKTICPFPNFDMQVRFALASIDGTFQLPSKDVMDQDVFHDYRWRQEIGWPHRYSHKMGVHQWQYMNHLADMAGLDKLPKVVEELYEHVYGIRMSQFCQYKDQDYELVDDEHFKALT